MSKKTVEEKYKKLSQKEHILLRPGMYIGSIKKQMEELWVPINGKMEKRMLEYTPGFIKIFDEVLTNATDHSFRDITVTNIKVDFNKETGEIIVWNNGSGIPIELHTEHNIYVPELIFGHLLSGSNYDDTEQRTGAGTNGIGSKASNIFSKRFVIETVDSINKKKFVQEYSNNMIDRTKAKITSNSGKSYTQICFIPDYSKFDMNGLEDDTILLLEKRVLDCIACTSASVNIYLNGVKLKGKGLIDYTKYFFENDKIFSESFTEKYKSKNGETIEYNWEYAIVPHTHFEQVSFVNGNTTIQGGKHVDYILYQIVNKLKKMLEEKKKLKDIKPNFIKDKLFLFLKATVANPAFNSQTKEQLTTLSKDFGCSITVSDAFITRLYKSSITEEIVNEIRAKEIVSLGKQTDGKKTSKVYIPKLEDALWAGTNKSEQCTLILTEGLSALTFALHGRSVVGPEKYGCFALKGKILNTKDATISQLVGNEEINNIKQILGLKQDKVYKTTSELRYAKVMILTDADSVTFDTPCIIKNIETNEIEIKPICEINNNNWSKDEFSQKEYSNCENYLVWSDNGWTKIKSIVRHLVNKPIHRVLTHTGCVDVTEDHSLLNKKGEEITVKDCIIKDTELLHHKYSQEKIIDYGINTDLAWAMGYFQADGHCFTDEMINQKRKDGTITTSYNSKWIISSIIEEPLIKLQKIFQDNEINNAIEQEIKNEEIIIEKELLKNQCDKCLKVFKFNCYLQTHINGPQSCIDKCSKCNKTFKDLRVHTNIKGDCTIIDKLEFVITKEKVSKSSFSQISGREFIYKLEAKGTRKNIANKYRKMFYNSLREKKVPTEILNNSIEIQQAFINGFYEGDRDKGLNHITDNFDGEYKSQIMGLFQVLQNCGYKPSINCSSTKLNVNVMSKVKGYNRPEHTIKKIINVSDKYKDTYVYDFETENHHFHASIGNIIVHNSDGQHIKSLFVNFIHTFWPSLLTINPDFIQTIKTPIVKAVKGNKVIEFFTEQDYMKWKDTGINLTNYKIKYFKGLGSSSKEEAKNIFNRFNELKVDYYFKDEKCNQAILLAFEKDKNIKQPKKNLDDESEENIEVIKCTDRRKIWLENYDKNSYVDVKENRVSYQDQINKELIHFSIYDNLRSIPSICDGLKPSQRKIIYYMLKKNITNVIKVAQLSGYVSAETGYHHGEASLQGAIINMAQNFIGANNVNLLYPDGNFGCLDPETDILMWLGNTKKAKNIIIGDELVGDDGNKRNVLKLIQGRSNMYELKLSNRDKYTVNEDHVLTLKYISHKIIFWRESDMSWRVNYFNNIEMKSNSKSFKTNMSTTNMSKLSKEEAYEKIRYFTENIHFPDIIDIKLSDYLKLNKTDKSMLYSIKNNSVIRWDTKPLPINPYILGAWLGDGNADGSGLTSADEEIVKEFVYYADTINCELVHDKNGIETKMTQHKTKGEIHENYHYGIRQKKSNLQTSRRISIGDTEHKSNICLTVKESHICNSYFEKSNYIENYCMGKNILGHNIEKNPWKQLLIDNKLYKNKYIPNDYIFNSKENRLQLLAGFIDTDGTIKMNNGTPKIEISQSNRLRRDLILQLKFICESLGFTCILSHYTTSKLTKKGKDVSSFTLNITGDNLHEIPTRVLRKKMELYKKFRDTNSYTFTVTDLGKNIYNGWEIDGNKRFLLGNFIVTHNSRYLLGKDAASPRYIFTKLSDITQTLFNKNDSPLLDFLDDNGSQIEPEWYLPIIPMILVNGCSGIGTGYSTSIPSYNPLDIISNLVNMIDDDDYQPLEMKPYFKGFHGQTIELEKGSFITKGKYEKMSSKQIKVTELPIGMGVTTYKEFLESLIVGNMSVKKGDIKLTKNKKKKFELKDVINKTKDENDDICFIIEFQNESDLSDLIKSDTLEKELKLTKSFSTNNMYLFNEKLILTKYDSPVEILCEFYDIRLEYYIKRKAYITKKLKQELVILESKSRFIKEYMNNKLDINKKSKDYINKLLEEREYPTEIEQDNLNKTFDYLLRMPIYSFTNEKIKDLESQCNNKRKELDFIKSKSASQLWKIDLQELTTKLD